MDEGEQANSVGTNLKAIKKMPVEIERAYPTPLSNSPLLPLLLLSLLRQRHSPNGSLKIKREYDYIVVGGGTAGSVVASRLSEKPCVNVLLLEAGPEPPLLTEVPALGRYFWNTDVDWQYKTTPQKHTGRALTNKQIVWPSGKMLGGSSSMNGMWYVRGNRKDYDEWAAIGAKGWSFRDVFPYFLKLENNKDYRFLTHGYHTRGGPVTVHQPRYESELKHAIEEAASSIGFKIVDSNAGRQTGFYEHQATVKGSQRCSTAKAYLVPAENRTNFDILPKARVKKIIIHHHRARGVRFAFHGRTYEVKARREVIVSAGTVNTAQILMLSGIGPKRELQKLNIPVIEDLPVGQNLHDHGGTHIPYVLSYHIPDFEEKISSPECIKQYIHNRTGPLASTVGVSYLAFLKGRKIHSSLDIPNYELYFSEMPTSIVKKQFGLKPEVYRKLYGQYENKPLFMCTVSLLHPKSRGSVTLRSKNPYEPPIIDPNYLEEPEDLDDLVQGMKTCHRIAKSRALWKLGATPFKTVIPGCEKYAYDEDEYFRCQARSIFVTLHDPVGTAKMGGPWDPTTVVDPKLRVKNIKGLRVIDASIMPKIPSGNTNIPTIMIAEKGSDIIKETIDCYKTYDSDEPEETSEWSHDDDYSDSWEEEEKWKIPDNDDDDEIIWVDDKDWRKPNDKESIWIEEGESWKNPKDTIWVEEDKWENPEEKDTIWVDDEKSWDNPKNKETTWVENVYTEVPKQQWEFPKTESWSDAEKKPVENYKPNTWPSTKKYPEFEKTNNGKFSLKDYIKNPEEISSILIDRDSSDKYSDTTRPHSWYKEHANIHLKQYKEPVTSSWKKEKTDSNIPWTESPSEVTKSIKELIKLAKWEHKGISSDESESLKEEDNYGVTKSIDELVKEAKKDNYVKEQASWLEPNNHGVKSNVDEFVHFAKEKHKDVNSDESESWKEQDDYGVTKSIDELVKKAERDNYAKKQASWLEPNNHGVKSSVDEFVKLAKDRNVFTKPYESWTEPSDYQVTESIDELIRQAETENKESKSYTPWEKAGNYTVSKNTEFLKLAETIPAKKTNVNQWEKSYEDSEIPWY